MLALIYRAGGMDGSRHIYVHICVLFSHATRLKVSIKAENETRKLSQRVIFDFFYFKKKHLCMMYQFLLKREIYVNYLF